jgi:hypothetical protein
MFSWYCGLTVLFNFSDQGVVNLVFAVGHLRINIAEVGILTVASLGGMEDGNRRAAWLQDFIRRRLLQASQRGGGAGAAGAKTTSPVTGWPKPVIP